jgi:predicted secreted protein
MANKIKGSNIVFYRVTDDGDIPFACMRNGEIFFEVDEKITNSQSSAFWEDSIPGLTRWGLSGDGLMTLNTQWNYLFLLNDVLNRQVFNVKAVIDNGGIEGLSIIQGQMFLRNLAISKKYNDVATYQVQMKGKGAPSLSGTIVQGNTIIIQNTTVQVFQAKTTEGQTVITFSGAIGLELLYASRGGIGAQPLFLLEGNGCTWNSATAQLTLASGGAEDENILILAQ